MIPFAAKAKAAANEEPSVLQLGLSVVGAVCLVALSAELRIEQPIPERDGSLAEAVARTVQHFLDILNILLSQ